MNDITVMAYALVFIAGALWKRELRWLWRRGRPLPAKARGRLRAFWREVALCARWVVTPAKAYSATAREADSWPVTNDSHPDHDVLELKDWEIELVPPKKRSPRRTRKPAK